MAAHGQVWAVHLQLEAGFYNFVVLCLHSSCKRLDELFMRGIELIAEESGKGARRRRCEKDR